MINIEFESVKEIDETLKIIGNAVESGYNKKHKTAYFTLKNKNYEISLEEDAFKAGVIYGLSISKDL